MRISVFRSSFALTAGFYQTIRAAGTMGVVPVQSLAKTATFGAGLLCFSPHTNRVVLTTVLTL